MTCPEMTARAILPTRAALAASTSAPAPRRPAKSARRRVAGAAPRPRRRPSASASSSATRAASDDDADLLLDTDPRGDRYFDAGDARPVILFDGVCNLCNGGVNLALDLDPPGELRFAALQSSAGRALLRRSGRDASDISSIVLVERDRSYVKSDAVLRIATYLKRMPLLPIAGVVGPLVPGFLRDAVYDLVANNRYELLGMKDECRLSDDRFDDRFVGE